MEDIYSGAIVIVAIKSAINHSGGKDIYYIYIHTSYIYILYIYAHRDVKGAGVGHLSKVTGCVLLPCRYLRRAMLAIPCLKDGPFPPAPLSLLRGNSRAEVCWIYI